jgi:hypothetical protein
VFTFGVLLIFSMATINVRADGPPTQEEAFDEHTFDEHYWDINVTNNEAWDHPEVNPEVSWKNNTWNVKWIKEDNFEMGMLAFIEKVHEEGDSLEMVKYTTPAQMWWQHVYLNGSEIYIASMHCAWFGFRDDNSSNNQYDEGEEITPFFYMGCNSTELKERVGIDSNPSTHVIPLQRSVSGDVITYTWGYNYTDIVFYVPRVNHLATHPGYGFEWGFNYSDPGSYINGSSAIGNQTYVYYEYTLEVDTNAGIATLYQDYETGEFGVLMDANVSGGPWEKLEPGDPDYMPEEWAMCLGTWAFIWAEQDPLLTDHEVGEINATCHKTGLTTVETTLGGTHAFDFKFEQKPNYHLEHINGTDMGDRPVLYECLDVNDDKEFIDFVSGMLPLVGEFGRLICCYAINQTNRFVGGLLFDDVWNDFEANDTAAFLITCYPDYGLAQGGKLKHDPVFTAYFAVKPEEGLIPGYPLELLTVLSLVGIISILIYYRKRKR